MFVSYSRLSLQMYRRFWSLEAGGCSFLNSWQGILGLDFVAEVFAIHASGCGFWLRHGAGDREFALGFDFSINRGDQFPVFGGCQPLFYVDQVIFKTGDGIAFAPKLEHWLGDVIGGVVYSVPLHAHHLGFDERGALAAAGAFAGFVGGVVDLAGIRAVDDHAGDAVADGALGKVFYAILHGAWRGIGPEITFDEEHETEILYGGKIQAFVGHAGRLAAVADVGHDRQ